MPKATWREFDDPVEKVREQNPLIIKPKGQREVRVQRTRGGKGGKTVTCIKGLGLDPVEARALLKSLKTKCGTGGTFKEDYLELQGDQVVLAMELLYQEGFRPKQAGG